MPRTIKVVADGSYTEVTTAIPATTPQQVQAPTAPTPKPAEAFVPKLEVVAEPQPGPYDAELTALNEAPAFKELQEQIDKARILVATIGEWVAEAESDEQAAKGALVAELAKPFETAAEVTKAATALRNVHEVKAAKLGLVRDYLRMHDSLLAERQAEFDRARGEALAKFVHEAELALVKEINEVHEAVRQELFRGWMQTPEFIRNPNEPSLSGEAKAKYYGELANCGEKKLQLLGLSGGKLSFLDDLPIPAMNFTQELHLGILEGKLPRAPFRGEA